MFFPPRPMLRAVVDPMLQDAQKIVLGDKSAANVQKLDSRSCARVQCKYDMFIKSSARGVGLVKVSCELRW